MITWLYETTFCLFHKSISIRYMQTLTTLNLEYNEIGEQGAEHLANALQQNKVAFLTSLDLPYN
jgi:hypothetical protein